MSGLGAAGPSAPADLEAPVDDGGLAVVRIKPLGAGGGGGERVDAGDVAVRADDGQGGSGGVWVRRPGGAEKRYRYPRHVILPDMGQDELYRLFMPQRVAAFLQGYNVNIMAYGQTGSGKTHTMFGPPGLMRWAAAGGVLEEGAPADAGGGAHEDLGLCPRGLLHIVRALEELRRSSPERRFELTASAVELTAADGNLDMFSKAVQRSSRASFNLFSGTQGVCVDKQVKPPILYGMSEIAIDGVASLLALFDAIACRNTSSTALNDTSSRSHCFVFLTLHTYDSTTGHLRVNRFQFIDLAGSERMRDAHGGIDYGNKSCMEGLMTNFGLMMLSQRVRELAAAGHSGKTREQLIQRSFKTQLDPDLLPLLSETLAGSALTLLVVCASAAVCNAPQSVNALDFGEVFSRLSMHPSPIPWAPLQKLEKRAAELAKLSQGLMDGGANKYDIVRAAQGRSGRQLEAVLQRLVGSEPSGRASGARDPTRETAG